MGGQIGVGWMGDESRFVGAFVGRHEGKRKRVPCKNGNMYKNTMIYERQFHQGPQIATCCERDINIVLTLLRSKIQGGAAALQRES